MRVPIETYVGNGWDQLLALSTLLGGLAAIVSTIVILWLRWRLRLYFVTRPDHERVVALHKSEHSQNLEAMKVLEERLQTLASRHSVVGIEQRQEALYHRVSSVEVAISGVSAQIGGVVKSNDRVEHMMDMVLQQMIQRDGAA